MRNAIPLYTVYFGSGVLPFFGMLRGDSDANEVQGFAIAAALAAGTSSAAMAQYACAPGYTYFNGVCNRCGRRGMETRYPARCPARRTGPRAANATGGPVGAVVGGALGTATARVTGTANALTGGPPVRTCYAGYTYYNGACYPVR